MGEVNDDDQYCSWRGAHSSREIAEGLDIGEICGLVSTLIRMAR